MEEYMKIYDQLDKKIVYEYDYRYGGIGDCIKYFIYLLQLCIQYNYKLHYLVNNTSIEKLIRLKYDHLYIHSNQLDNPGRINHINEITNISNGEYLIRPHILYYVFYNDLIDLKIGDIFYFTDEIKMNVPTMLRLPMPIMNYTSVHLRLGDKYLETDKDVIYCINDSRRYDETRLFEFMDTNDPQTILFFCDNNEYKQKMKKKYDSLLITTCNIAHTSLSNTTYKQTVDAITEFYIMTETKEVVAVSESGFSEIASKFKRVPLIKLYKDL